MRGDSFLRIRRSLIQKNLHLVANFDDFLRNNNVFTQENRTFKKHQPRKKLIFWQFVVDFWIFGGIIAYLGKTIVRFKNILLEESLCFDN